MDVLGSNTSIDALYSMDDLNTLAAAEELDNTTIADLIISTTTPSEYTIWDDPESKNTRRTVYWILHGVVGLFTILVNGFLLCIYHKRAKIQKHTSFIMLNVFVSCFLHGWVVGLIYPLQRVYRYEMSIELCVITTLIMDWADRYILLLLPFLAIERLVYLKRPFRPKQQTKRFALIVSLSILIFSALYTWLPLIPALSVPEAPKITNSNDQRQKEINDFYTAWTCHGRINKKNRLEPIFILAVSTLCVVVVIVVYIWMFMIAKARFAAFPNMTQNRKHKMKKAAISVMLVSATFIFTLMPYGIIYPMRNLCDTNVAILKNAFCNGMTLELRFIFSIVAHLGNIFAPLLFALLNPHTRAAIKHYLSCNKRVKTICKSMKNKEGKPHFIDETIAEPESFPPRPRAVVPSYHTGVKNGLSSDTTQMSYQLPSEMPDTLISPIDYL